MACINTYRAGVEGPHKGAKRLAQVETLKHQLRPTQSQQPPSPSTAHHQIAHTSKYLYVYALLCIAASRRPQHPPAYSPSPTLTSAFPRPAALSAPAQAVKSLSQHPTRQAPGHNSASPAHSHRAPVSRPPKASPGIHLQSSTIDQNNP
ncbi:hypothetical protein K504DRAFT_507510 [Pleomassaria siparia CBS 279.74]|uniref:Uncharacterized protein n=1 Tax=Pleomassaria siparia CBS 279.74 TaxID=1314801 RepID=A0A6G1JTQ1_9PLEO|nr:hypothetical protein K504DRAFT_507510 [Pleomassaria siparia CBS 279.74]